MKTKTTIQRPPTQEMSSPDHLHPFQGRWQAADAAAQGTTTTTIFIMATTNQLTVRCCRRRRRGGRVDKPIRRMLHHCQVEDLPERLSGQNRRRRGVD
jgi:hypothetical protein